MGLRDWKIFRKNKKASDGDEMKIGISNSGIRDSHIEFGKQDPNSDTGDLASESKKREEWKKVLDRTPDDIRRDERHRQRQAIKKRRTRRNRFFAAILVLVVLLFVAKSCMFRGPVEPLKSVNGIQVHQEYLPLGIPGRPGEERKVKYIVVHETGNTKVGATAASHSTYINDEAAKEKLSWHYTVDDTEIYQHLPDEEVGYHAGAIKGNQYGIGVELCVNSDGNYEKTLQNGAALVAALMKAHHLSINDVKQHYDFSGKNCPEIMRETGRWDEFLGMTEEYRNKI